MSNAAKQRLKIIDRYQHTSQYFSKNKKPNAAITCRHFGIHRSYFNRWWARYKQGSIYALEEKSRPHKKKNRARYSKKKLFHTCRGLENKPLLRTCKKIYALMVQELPHHEIATTCSSVSGKNALNKITERFGKQIIIVNDNGSENMDKAEQWLEKVRKLPSSCRS